MYRKFTSVESVVFVIAELISCKKFRCIVKSVKFRNPMLCTGSINGLLKKQKERYQIENVSFLVPEVKIAGKPASTCRYTSDAALPIPLDAERLV